MKTVLLAVVVLGFAIMADGQTRAEQTLLNASIPVRMNADQRQGDGDAVLLRGNVELVIGTVTIRADEADLSVNRTGVEPGQQGPIEVELRGRVRTTIQPQ